MDTTRIPTTPEVPSFESFKNNLGDFFSTQFMLHGYSYPCDEDPCKKAALFWAMQMRTIAPRPRRVYWSDKLLTKSAILDPSISLALKTIEAESLAGMDLNPRMSRRQKDVECHDNLFNDWGILHLHLGPRKANVNDLVISTGDLLFVLVRRDELYFVDQLNHDVFHDADAALLEIIHRNWPHLIADSRCDDVSVDDEDQVSSKSRAKLRHRGFTFPTAMSDGTVYLQTGGGMVMSPVKRGKLGKLNFDAVIWANNLFRRAHKIHKWCVENPLNLLAQIQRQAGVEPTSLKELRLCLDKHGLFLLDKATGAGLRFD